MGQPGHDHQFASVFPRNLVGGGRRAALGEPVPRGRGPRGGSAGRRQIRHVHTRHRPSVLVLPAPNAVQLQTPGPCMRINRQ